MLLTGGGVHTAPFTLVTLFQVEEPPRACKIWICLWLFAHLRALFAILTSNANIIPIKELKYNKIINKTFYCW